VLSYFFALHMLVEACQSPPAFTQSAWLVIVDSDGLAEGDAPEEEPDVDGLAEVPEPPVLPPLVLPVLPDGEPVVPVEPAPVEPAPVEPAAPLLLPPLDEPPAACASAGTKQIIPIRTRESIFFIPNSSLAAVQRDLFFSAGQDG
jgi:hypothetical protein